MRAGVAAGIVVACLAGARIFGSIAADVLGAGQPSAVANAQVQQAKDAHDGAAHDGAGAAVPGNPLGDGPITKPGPPGEVHPLLMARFKAAQADARKEGHDLHITSGWRSVEEQRQLFEQRVQELGSRAEAERLVAPPETSAHVKGLAIDVGEPDGAAWLDQHSAAYGLCRMYENEPWHFEPVIAPGGTCPPLQATAGGLWD